MTAHEKIEENRPETEEAPEALQAKKEKGATMVEYAIVLGLIAVTAILAIRVLGRQVSKQFSNVATQL